MKKSSRKLVIYALVVAAVGLAGYFKYGRKAAPEVTSYSVAKAESSSVVVTAEGSGQINSAEEAAVKPETSGKVVKVYVKSGDTVKAGDALFDLDSSNAYDAVRDAEINLENAKISLQRLQDPPDDLDQLKSKNSLLSAKESLTKAQENLDDSIDSGYDDVVSAFLSLPDVMTGLHAILYEADPQNSDPQWGIDYYADRASTYDNKINVYKAQVANKFSETKAAYDRTLSNYKATGRGADTAMIEALINDTRTLTLQIDDLTKATDNFIQYYEDTLTYRNVPVAVFTSKHQGWLDDYTRTLSSIVSTLTKSSDSIETARDSIVQNARTLAEREATYDDLMSGPDELDVASQELTVRQRQAALQDAREKLADYRTRSPISGRVISVDIEPGDAVTTATEAITVISPNQVAVISLSEIDAAAVKVGQKATLTFDAVPDLVITGAVSEIADIGSVSQGVVTYETKVTLDTQDDRIKPSMTVSAAIITESSLNVLTVPVGAIKTAGNSKYVEKVEFAEAPASTDGLTLTPDQISRVTVTTGLTDGLITEIADGLESGDYVITRTSSAASTATSQQTNGNSMFGGMPGGARLMR